MSIKSNAEIARRHNHARTEFLNIVDATPSRAVEMKKTLAVITASLEAFVRARGDREATRRRLEARKKTS